MIKEVKLPEISEGVDTGDVTKVLVSVGDLVKVDDPLVELETDKAVFELPSTEAGEVVEILVSEGDTVTVGQALVRIETEVGGAADREEKKEPPIEKESAAADEVRETPPVKKEPAAADEDREAPPVKKEPAAADEDSEAPPAEKESAAADEQTEAPPQTAATEKPTGPVTKAKMPPPAAAPSVRRLARELGVDIYQVAGTGKAGKISADDVKLYAKGVITAAHAAPAAGRAAAAPQLPDFSKFGEIERKPMSKVRRITAENMSMAWTTVPHVTQNDEADITDLEAARKRHGKSVEEAGGKLTMTAILLKACAAALKKFPDFNASVDMAAGEIIFKKYVNIGVAVDTERGLLVPVIRNVDCKSIVQLAVELTEISDKARNKKITPDQLEGGNFTISNLGGIGGTHFSPIVYAPDVAILGVSRAVTKPRWNTETDEFEPRLIMPLSLSYDHRVIDGALAVRFTRWLALALEDPVLLALGG
ncbi:MAG: 2-oxo acid dehydrogenase subunit E2 [Candidatus Latescibacterota bacterium]|nr:MAG: 2-oxo acid dehydrogenase subunit E2 [Candidatus Latescibacterota bacterium]